MKSTILFLAAMSMFSTRAVATPPELAIIKSVTCVSGEIELSKTVFAPDQRTSFESLAAYSSGLSGSSFVTNDYAAVLTLPVSGNNDGVCPNFDRGTILVITATK
jgi:hypothetical protein